MKRNYYKKVLSMFLAVSFSAASLPAEISASETKTTAAQNTEYVSTFQTSESTLAPGITQTVNSAYGADGALINYYVAVADLDNAYVGVQATYKDAQCQTTGLSKMTEQAEAMYKKHTNSKDQTNYIANYTIVAGINGDGYNTANAMPSGAHVMNGVNGFNIKKSANSSWFAVFADGKALCGADDKDWDEAVAKHGAVKEAIGGFQLVRKNGVDIPYTESNYLNSSRYPRSFVGVTDDNKVVFMIADGSNSGGSAGTNYNESLEIMNDAGCTYILCLDGGGSATYISRQADSNDIQVTSRPSDGSERAVSNGLIMYSSAPSSDTFEKAEITAENYYVTPNSRVRISAVGVSPAGTEVKLPAGAVWTATHGKIEGNVFVSDGTTGDAKISLKADGREIGSTTIHVVYPDTVAFARDVMNVPFGAAVDLEVIAKYRLHNVAVKDGDFTFHIQNQKAGSISGNQFTAAGENANLAETTITVSVKGVSGVTDTLTVKLGKGSDVIFDFEKGTDGANLNNWKVKDHNNSMDDLCSEVSIVNKKTGMVHSGDSALAFHYKMDEEINGTKSLEGDGIAWVGKSIEVKNAVGLGFWLYVPEDCTQLAIWAGTSLHDEKGEFKKKNIYNLALYNDDSVNHMEYSGWHYFKVPITDPTVYIETNDDKAGGTALAASANAFIKIYAVNIDAEKNQETNYMGDFTFYIDDITVDYSDAVDDRENPIFSGMTYAADNMSGAKELNGQTAADNTVSFAGKVSEDMTNPANASGLNASSAAAYIDGVPVDCVYTDGLITVSDMVLTNGVHTVRMGISDKMGNYSEIKRQIVIADPKEKTPTVRVRPHDNTLDGKVQNGSVYWVDIETDAVETVKSIEMKLDLDSMNDWQPEHIETLSGFTCTYSFADVNDKAENILTVRFERNRDYLAETGTKVIASLPIRVWDYVGSAGGHKHANAVEAWNCDSPCIPALSVDVDTEKGVVTYLDNSSHTFSGADIHTRSVAYTYGEQMKVSDHAYYTAHCFHIHKTENKNKAATCTEDGYTGRTICTVCNSPVVWGTTVKATGHTFALTDSVLKCHCGQTYTGVWINGKTYVNGKLHADGWDKDDCYWKDGKKLTGIQLVENYYYNFGENGVCKGKAKYSGLLYDETVSAWRYSKLGKLFGGWVQINGGWHYFDKETKVAATGNRYWPTHDGITYRFDETGRTEGVWSKSSLGTRFWYGEWYYQARNPYQRYFVKIGGKTYNFDANGYVTPGIHALYNDWASRMREEMTLYEFDNTGALIGEVKATGLVSNKQGDWYLVEEDGFVHGGKEKCVKYQGNIYFVQNSGKLTFNNYQEITAESGKGLLKPGRYYFDQNGRLFTGEKKDKTGTYYYENGQPLTGIKKESDGSLYYYQNGQIAVGIKNKLVQINDQIYFIKTGSRAAADETIEITKNNGNGLLANGSYYFGTDGRLFTGVKKNAADGQFYYYSKGNIAKGIYNNELVSANGDIYFVKWSGKAAAGELREVTASNSHKLLTNGSYYFGKDGKLSTVTGIVWDEITKLYYYCKNGKLGTGAYNNQLAKINGDIYFVKWSGKIAVNELREITAENSSKLLSPGSYKFGADGKLLEGEKKDEDGNLRYYENGQPYTGTKKNAADGLLYYYSEGKLAKGVYNNELVSANGSIYFVKWSGKAAANELREVTASNSHKLLANGSYYFGKDGKLTSATGIVWDEITKLYYYCKNGRLGTGAYNNQLAKINGDIYFVKWSGKIAVNELREITASNSSKLLAPGSYKFGADGKLLEGEKKDEDGSLRYYENGQPLTGTKKEADGLLYYYSEGKLAKGVYNNELVSANGSIYFVKWSGKVAANEVREVTASNSHKLLANGSYYFGKDGKLISTTGLVWDETAKLYYYCKNGRLCVGEYNNQLAKINGDIYFVKWSGKVAAGEIREITAANSNKLLKPGFYEFGADGKLYQGEKKDAAGEMRYYENGQPLTGTKKEADGLLYYYSEGKLAKGTYNNELVSANGEIYFVKWSGKVAVNELREVTASNSHKLLANGSYYFGKDGKLTSATGIVWDEITKLYYYCKNGKLGTGAYNNQLAKINGDIYFVKWSGKVAVNELREITASNSGGFLKPGSYYFGADGKLQLA